MTEMIRDNKGKPPLSILPREALEEVARVMDFGAKKYSMHNWRNGGKNASSHSLMDSALRHMYAYLDGEDEDSESKLHHIGHAMCNMAFLLTHYKKGTLLDDRHSPTNDTLSDFQPPMYNKPPGIILTTGNTDEFDEQHVKLNTSNDPTELTPGQIKYQLGSPKPNEDNFDGHQYKCDDPSEVTKEQIKNIPENTNKIVLPDEFTEDEKNMNLAHHKDALFLGSPHLNKDDGTGDEITYDVEGSKAELDEINDKNRPKIMNMLTRKRQEDGFLRETGQFDKVYAHLGLSNAIN